MRRRRDVSYAADAGRLRPRPSSAPSTKTRSHERHHQFETEIRRRSLRDGVSFALIAIIAAVGIVTGTGTGGMLIRFGRWQREIDSLRAFED